MARRKKFTDGARSIANTHRIKSVQTPDGEEAEIRVGEDGVFCAFDDARNLLGEAETVAGAEKLCKKKGVKVDPPLKVLVMRRGFSSENYHIHTPVENVPTGEGGFRRVEGEKEWRDPCRLGFIVGVTPGNRIRWKKATANGEEPTGEVVTENRYPDYFFFNYDPKLNARRIELSQLLFESEKEIEKIRKTVGSVQGKDFRPVEVGKG